MPNSVQLLAHEADVIAPRFNKDDRARNGWRIPA